MVTGRDLTDGEADSVLTTLNGDVVVFELAASGSQVVIGNLLYHQIFDGAMGASNSIVFLDDPQTVPTIYIASSMGTRKLTRSL